MSRARALILVWLAACSSSNPRQPPPATGSDTEVPGSASGDRAGTDAAPIDAAPIDAVPIDATPIDAAPIDAAPIDARGAVDATMRADASVDAGDQSTTTTGCPASFAAATGSCARGTQCAFREGTCSCARPAWCGGAAPSDELLNQPPVWQCIPTVRPDGCPGSMPVAGGRCTREGQRCDYTCSCVAAAVCTNGAWKLQSGPCKPSARPQRGSPAE